MNSKEKKVVIENVRNECARKYRERISQLEEQTDGLWKTLVDAQEQNRILRDENERLRDWVERMQTYIGMTDEERDKMFAESELAEKLGNHWKMLNGLFNICQL